jgi:hypothetical protein
VVNTGKTINYDYRSGYSSEDRRDVLTGVSALDRNKRELFSLELPIVMTVCGVFDKYGSLGLEVHASKVNNTLHGKF